jgi:hypothetical protein
MCRRVERGVAFLVGCCRACCRRLLRLNRSRHCQNGVVEGREGSEGLFEQSARSATKSSASDIQARKSDRCASERVPGLAALTALSAAHRCENPRGCMTPRKDGKHRPRPSHVERLTLAVVSRPFVPRYQRRQLRGRLAPGVLSLQNARRRENRFRAGQVDVAWRRCGLSVVSGRRRR